MEITQRDFELFIEGLRKAGKRMVDPHCFQLPVAGGESLIFRERVYCYEFYHQIRTTLGDNFPYKMDGEVDKNGHPIIPGDMKPDFIVHVPGQMDKNLVVIEVKPVTVSDSDLESDIKKLAWLLDKGKYFRAIMLVYGDGKTQLPTKILSQVTNFSRRQKNRILLAWHSGSAEEIEILERAQSQ